MGQHLVAILELNAKHCIGQWLYYLAFENYRVFFGFSQNCSLERLFARDALRKRSQKGDLQC